MPYWRHPKDTDPVCHGDPFGTMQEAREGIDPKTHTVTFVATEDEKYEWQARERRRFDTGDYMPVPWVRECGLTYFDDRIGLSLATREHFPHLSISHPGLIAYTKNDEHGVQDRQTRVKPGKYLTEFYSDVFSLEQIDRYVSECKAENLELKIATDADTIAKVYIHGPNSCMGGSEAAEKGERFTTVSKHPARVYGDSDLAVAYLGDPDTKITARCVVWPERKHHTRAYGDRTLSMLLKGNGYKLASLDGACVRAIELRSNQYLMPYIDRFDSVSGTPKGMTADLLTDHRFLLHDYDGDFDCNETCGWINCRDHDDDDDDCSDNDDGRLYTCERCHSDYDYSAQHHSELNLRWCSECLDERNQCASCERFAWDEMTATQDGGGGGLLCDQCLENESSTCDCGETWHEQVEFSPAERESRDERHVVALCHECAIDPETGADLQICLHCGGAFDASLPRCTACNRAVRCQLTASLPFRDRRPPHTGTGLAWIMRVGAWETLDADTECNISHCRADLPVGTLAFRGPYDTEDGQPVAYCRRCAQHYLAHYGYDCPLPSAAEQIAQEPEESEEDMSASEQSRESGTESAAF